MHPDRIALLSASDHPSSTVTSTQRPPHATPDGSQQRLPLEELLADLSQSLPTFFPVANATASPRDGYTPTTTSDSNNRHIHAQSHRNPNRSPSWGGMGMGDRKRRASETFLSHKSPKPPKMHKVGKGTVVGGNGAAKGQGKPKNLKKKKKKAKQNGQPGPSNLAREEGEVVDEDDGRAYEDGGVYGGFGFGDRPDRDPAYPHQAD